MQVAHDTAVTSTLPSSSSAVECGFDAAGAAHIQSILTYMYRDAPMAALREYATNARDAHIRAGNPAPIEVTLPTEWEPTLTVTDHGPGLSEQDIITVYSPYGTSTKRDTNTEVGAFGIGAKAAFAVTPQFAVTGVKDGAKVNALFALNEDGVATVEIVNRDTTTAPNGVTVKVPVDDPAAMRQAADRLFGYWEPGTVVVDGKQPTYLPGEMLRITDTIFADHGGTQVNWRRGETVADDASTSVMVVMGGIPYPASVAMLRTVARRLTDHPGARELAGELANKHTHLRLVVLAGIGEVDITPSREDLRDTPRTLTVLQRVLRTYADSVRSAVETALNAEPSAMHASMRMAVLFPFLRTSRGRVEVAWRGQRLQLELRLPYPVIVRSVTETSSRCRLHNGITVYLGHSFDATRVITGVDVDGERVVRRLANRFMTKHGLAQLILVPPSAGQVGWFEFGPDAPITTIAFDDFHREARGLPGVTTSRDPEYHVRAAGPMTANAIKDRAAASGGRILLATRDFVSGERHVVDDMLSPADLLVTLAGNQSADAFFRRVPTALPAAQVMRDHAQKLLREATEAERQALAHVPDVALQAVHNNGVLRRIEPLKRLVNEYVAAERAFNAISPSRINLLLGAEHVLGIARARQLSSSGLPLLDLFLNQIRATSTTSGPARPIADALVTDLVEYLTTTHQTAA